jgi:protein-L-isoaspartate(D-aspartate) O-methyltransferase
MVEPAVQKAHAKLMAQIDAGMRQTARATGRDRLSPRVRAAMERVPRDEFVQPHQSEYAYYDEPLPIGHGQTISQPFIVALMTELLDPLPTDVVLEVGTGSGYATAVLAEIVERIYSVEVIRDLADTARDRLRRLGYANVEVMHEDGHQGWMDEAPYDGVLVTAAAPFIPPALVEQLKEGGRMVIPVGARFGPQDLLVVEKDERGEVFERSMLPVAFVPLV